MFLFSSTSNMALSEVMNAPWLSLEKTKPGALRTSPKFRSYGFQSSWAKLDIGTVSCTLDKYCKPSGKEGMEILPPPMVSGGTGAASAGYSLGYGAHVPVWWLGML